MQARARDLFYGLWTNDLFMRRVEANAEWSLFCPNEAAGLAETWGEEFDALYARYEREGRAKKVIKAQQLWFAILEAQVCAVRLTAATLWQSLTDTTHPGRLHALGAQLTCGCPLGLCKH